MSKNISFSFRIGYLEKTVRLVLSSDDLRLVEKVAYEENISQERVIETFVHVAADIYRKQAGEAKVENKPDVRQDPVKFPDVCEMCRVPLTGMNQGLRSKDYPTVCKDCDYKFR